MWVSYNLNDFIKFKTGDDGRDVWSKHYKDIGIDFVVPAPDKGGYYKMQMWSFMRIFGPEMHCGMVQVIKTEILLKESGIKKLAE